MSDKSLEELLLGTAKTISPGVVRSKLDTLAVQVGALERQAFIIADGNAEWREENELLHARIEALEAALREIEAETRIKRKTWYVRVEALRNIMQKAHATLNPGDTDERT